MINIWVYSLVSILIVSLVSFIGLLTFPFSGEKFKKILIYLVSFSAGALFGDAFIHLIPEAVSKYGFTLRISLYLILGIAISFIVEKIIHWRHCHHNNKKERIHPFAIMNLFGDIIHNFIDGLIIGASYLVSIPVGIATTLAVIFHEIPQEIGDFGVLLKGGFSRSKALLFNFLTALTAVFGTVVALLISSYIGNITLFLIPFAAGGFIYIAGSDFIPELHKEVKASKSLIQFIAFAAAIGIMIALRLID